MFRRSLHMPTWSRGVRVRTIALLLACVGAVSALLVAQERTIDIKMVKTEYKMDQLIAPSPLSDEALRGRALWVQRCAFCHDGVGTPTYNTVGPWLDSALVTARGDAAVRTKILKGSATMPGFQYGLKMPQVDQVLAFLKTISPNDKPTADQRAGKTKLPGDLSALESARIPERVETDLWTLPIPNIRSLPSRPRARNGCSRR